MTIQEVLYNKKSEIRKYVEQDKMSTSALGKMFNCNPGTIWYFLRDNNIKTVNKRSLNYGKIEKQKDVIIELFDSGESTYKIGKKLGISKPSILRWLTKWGCNTSRDAKLQKGKPFLKDQYKRAIELYLDGMSQEEVANEMGYSSGQISILLNKHNVKIRPTNKYTVREDYFDKIDCETKAYVCGWMWSDGNTTPEGKVRISLQEKDGAILEWMKQEMEYTGPLYYKKAESDSRQPQVEFCVNRQRLAKPLIALGCVPNKSLTLSFPYQIPKELYPHFIRAVFDGDGSIDKKHGSLTITSSYTFVNQLKEILPCEITNIYQRYKDKPANQSAHTLFIGRRTEKIRFLNYIYANHTICLKRKYDIARSIFQGLFP